MRISAEEENPARICVEKRGENDSIFATIKRFSLVLSDRLFVVRQIWRMTDEGRACELYCASIPLDVDFGIRQRTKTTRALTHFLLRAELIGGNNSKSAVAQSKVELLQFVDPRGFIPKWVVKMKLPQALGVVIEARDEFKRDEAVDRTALELIIANMNSANETYTEEEDSIVSNLMIQGKRASLSKLEHVPTADNFLRVQANYAGGGRGLGKGTITLDSTVEELAANEYLATSREMTARFDGKVERNVAKISNHAQIVEQVRKLDVPGLRRRSIGFKVIWKKVGDGEYAVVHSSLPVDSELKIEAKLKKGSYVRATIQTLAHFQPLPAVNGVPQTKLTYYMIEVDMAGHIPKPLVNSNLASFFSNLSVLRARYDKSLQIDAEERNKLVDVILADDNPRDKFSADEAAILAEAANSLDEYNDIATLSPETIRLDGFEAFTSCCVIGKDATKKQRWGKVVTRIRASPEQVLAYLLVNNSRCRMSREDLEKEMKVLKDHRRYTFHRFKTGAVFDLFSLLLWKEDEEEMGDYTVCSVPSKEALRELSELSTSNKLHKSTKLIELAEYYKIQAEGNETLVTHLLTIPDSHWHVPVSELQFFMRTLPQKSIYFWRHTYALHEWEELDGVFFGKLLMYTHAVKSSNLADLWQGTESLKVLGERYPWLESFVGVLCENKLLGHLSRSLPLKSNLDSITPQEGKVLGARFAPHLAMNLVPSAAVDEYILTYESLQELEGRLKKWFRPFLGVVAADLLAREPWGLKLRLFLGASLSIVDVATDIFMSWTYFTSKEDGAAQFGVSILIMLGVSNGQQQFLGGKSDAAKSAVFTRNEAIWRPIKKEISTWLVDNWLDWNRKKPEWFSEKFRASIPEDMVPDIENLESLRLQSGISTQNSSDSSSSLSTFNYYNPGSDTISSYRSR
ncbi:hypothetical protein TrST_g11683 [Triparma strigata]|uniref:START domain-containing protein n=1 Tax=Triparma strigata TaxID=1606541 RepID=A0A9W7B1N9_9STRA|nr:hypothetical protein TrST_g11683 [Triparma strigata]